MELGGQLLNRRNTLWIACGVLLALALIPGMPKFAFVLMAAGVGAVARNLGEGKCRWRGRGKCRFFRCVAE